MSAVSVPGLEVQLDEAKRNVFLLTAAQAIMGSAAPMSFSVGALAGYQLLGADKSLATAPLTGFNIGVALGAICVAAASRFLGRKAGFMVGALMCSIGGGIAAVALFRSDFWLFAIGLLLIGISGGFTQKIRFAAADASPLFLQAESHFTDIGGWHRLGDHRAAACHFRQGCLRTGHLRRCFHRAGAARHHRDCHSSIPEIAGPEGRLYPRAGGTAFVGNRAHAPVCHRHGLRHRFLCVDDLHDDRRAARHGGRMRVSHRTCDARHPVARSRHVRPKFLHRYVDCAIRRGKIVAAGLVVLMACAVVAHMGIELWNFWAALILLGLGWNFGFIGATAIITSSYRPHEADKVQGFHDIVLFGTVALSSFSSGKVFTARGWSVMNLVIWPVAGLCLVLVASLLLTPRRNAA